MNNSLPTSAQPFVHANTKTPLTLAVDYIELLSTLLEHFAQVSDIDLEETFISSRNNVTGETLRKVSVKELIASARSVEDSC